jgi:Fe-S-cluster-containing dehydrogenase component
MPTYIMVIKTRLCTGCQTCSVACKMENLTLPGIARTTITERPDGSWSTGICMQCQEPPCVEVCPVDATWKNELGITVIDQSICIGCGLCVDACPYDARCLNPELSSSDDSAPYVQTAIEAGESHRIHLAGKADKCDFCLHRIESGEPPMCVESCTTGARVFGDPDDTNSEVYRLLAEGAEPAKAELGTKPRVFFL